ncbi:putative zinc-binding metallopeptidase [soil metagenome]
MLRFACPVCAREVFFDDRRCRNCGTELVFDRGTAEFVPAEGRIRCANAEVIGCTWQAHREGWRCTACLITRHHPTTGSAEATANWAAAERAKRHVVVELDRLGLRLEARDEVAGTGLAIDMEWSPDGSVTIGHEDGVITLDAGEADDARRERLRTRLSEPYRTMLGHLRHEIGHYWWPLLADERAGEAGRLAEVRQVFGDERADYQAAIDRHYAQGPPSGWRTEFVSAYATMHPWEDWAETFAHYLHIRDTLDTACRFGLSVGVPLLGVAEPVAAGILADARDVGVAVLFREWGALTVAVNALNRSMDQPDLYPFALTKAVKAKLSLVHDLVVAGPVG